MTCSNQVKGEMRVTKPTVRVGNELGDWLQISFGEPVHPGDPSDHGWISTPIEADLAGLFRARVFAQLLLDEIGTFRRQLDEVCAAGSGTAELASVERWIELRVALSGGDVTVTGELSAPRTPNVRLAFEIPEVTPEQVRTMAAELRAAEEHLTTPAGTQPPGIGDINH